MQTTRRILLIAPNFPPQLNAEAIVNGKLARALINQGMDCTVVAQAPDPRFHLHDASNCWENKLGKVIRLSPPRYLRPWKLANIVSKAVMAERYCSWFSLAASRYCRKLVRQTTFDLVITRSLPVDAMLVGYRLKKEFNLKWIAGFNDPFPPCLDAEEGSPRSIFDHYELALVRQALSCADRILFPSRRLAAGMLAHWKLPLDDRVVVAPHIGWKAPALDSSSRAEEIINIGTLGPEVSILFPKLFAETIQTHPRLAERISLHLVGRVHPSYQAQIRERGLEPQVQVEAPVSYEESLQRMAESLALVVLEFNFQEGINLLSKVADYAVSRKPLLFFSPSVGITSDLVGGFSHPGFLGQQEETVRRGLDRFWRRVEEGAPLADYQFPHSEQFEPANVVEKILRS